MADRSIPPDSVIVAAAEEAGLCFPRCWNLDEAISPAVLQENRDWEESGYPFPEDVAAYTEWHSAYYHHEALDNDLDLGRLNPYPDAPPHRRQRYLTLTA